MLCGIESKEKQPRFAQSGSIFVPKLHRRAKNHVDMSLATRGKLLASLALYIYICSCTVGRWKDNNQPHTNMCKLQFEVAHLNLKAIVILI